MFSLNTFSVARLNNAEACAFYNNVQRVINDLDPDNFPMPADLQSQYGTKLQKLIDQVYNSSASAYTAAMQTADKKRCSIYRRIRLKLQTVLYTESGDATYAYRDVIEADLLGKYGSDVPQMALQEKTAILKGFVYDVQNTLSTAGMQAVGVSSDVTALDDANEAFVNAYNSRTSERAEAEQGLTLSLRNDLLSIFKQTAYLALYYANSTLTTDAAKTSECQKFINYANQLLAEAKTRFMIRTGAVSDTTDTDSADTSAVTDAATTSGTASSSGTSGSTTSGTSSSSGTTDSSTGDGKFVDGVYMVE